MKENRVTRSRHSSDFIGQTGGEIARALSAILPIFDIIEAERDELSVRCEFMDTTSSRPFEVKIARIHHPMVPNREKIGLAERVCQIS
jgi:hypothetical protein